MDKSWILLPRNSLAYQQWVNGFLDFAVARSSVDTKILCPCSLCNFRKWLTRDVVHEHLIIKDMYEAWVSEFAPTQSSKLLGAHHPTDPLHKCISFNQNWKLNVQELMLWKKKLQKCMIWNKKLLSLEV